MKRNTGRREGISFKEELVAEHTQIEIPTKHYIRKEEEARPHPILSSGIFLLPSAEGWNSLFGLLPLLLAPSSLTTGPVRRRSNIDSGTKP